MVDSLRSETLQLKVSSPKASPKAPCRGSPQCRFLGASCCYSGGIIRLEFRVQGFGVWVVWADSEEFRHDQKAQYAIVPQS